MAKSEHALFVETRWMINKTRRAQIIEPLCRAWSKSLSAFAVPLEQFFDPEQSVTMTNREPDERRSEDITLQQSWSRASTDERPTTPGAE